MVTAAFRQKGHDAFSCDILPTSGGNSQWHFQCGITRLLFAPWDLIIAFPPCTHLCVSGARWFKQKAEEQKKGINFFLMFSRLECAWAIENPVGIMSTHYRKPDQIIQPWQYGHGETKATCLWLNRLPKLIPSHIVPGREQRIHKLPPQADRGKLRSKTYPGIALAMAEQWGR